MKLILLALLLASCGKPQTTNIHNSFDDSKIMALDIIYDARIKVIETRMNALETLVGTNQAGNASFNAIIQANFITSMNTLTELQTEVTKNKVEIVPICNTAEHLIKINGTYFAVYMVSNNLGTYLGKLEKGITYQTTDSNQDKFTLNDLTIECL